MSPATHYPRLDPGGGRRPVPGTAKPAEQRRPSSAGEPLLSSEREGLAKTARGLQAATAIPATMAGHAPWSVGRARRACIASAPGASGAAKPPGQPYRGDWRPRSIVTFTAQQIPQVPAKRRGDFAQLPQSESARQRPDCDEAEHGAELGREAVAQHDAQRARGEHHARGQDPVALCAGRGVLRAPAPAQCHPPR